MVYQYTVSVGHCETFTPNYVCLMDVAYVLSMAIYYQMEETYVPKAEILYLTLASLSRKTLGNKEY